MLSELTRQAVESVAFVLNGAIHLRAMNSERSLSEWIATTARFSTSHELQLRAAIWLGHVEADNGCTLEQIVEAARRAEYASGKGCDYCAEGFPLRERDGMHYGTQSKGMIPDERCVLWFSPADLFTAIANEGIAKGRATGHCDECGHEELISVWTLDHDGLRRCKCGSLAVRESRVPSWFDDHARFTIQRGVQDWRFEIPPLVIEIEGGT